MNSDFGFMITRSENSLSVVSEIGIPVLNKTERHGNCKALWHKWALGSQRWLRASLKLGFLSLTSIIIFGAFSIHRDNLLKTLASVL